MGSTPFAGLCFAERSIVENKHAELGLPYEVGLAS